MDKELHAKLKAFVEAYATQNTENADQLIHEYICKKSQAMLLGETDVEKDGNNDSSEDEDEDKNKDVEDSDDEDADDEDADDEDEDEKDSDNKKDK